MYYIWGEDFCEGLVGPFDSKEAAETHLDFQRKRGDAAACIGPSKIMTEQEAKQTWSWTNNLCTPEKDRLDI